MRVEQMLRKEIETLPPEVASRKDGHNLGIVVEFSDGPFHSIMPSDDVVARRLASEMAGACGAANAIKERTPTASTVTAPESVVFKNRQAIGDILCMTAAVRDFKKTFPATRVGVITTAMHLWDHNPNFDHQSKMKPRLWKWVQALAPTAATPGIFT